MLTRFGPTCCAAFGCFLFALFAILLIPYPGVQSDEALFVTPVYYPNSTPGIRVMGSRLPLMLMDYLGTVKTWLYRPFVIKWRPGAWSLRLPVAAIGVVTVWLFYLLLRRIACRRTAAIGAILLGADTAFVLTTVFDWGPVAIQHLAITAALLLLVRFHQTGSRAALAGAFLLLGLGLWDKALFLWVLGGVAAAAALLLWREVRQAISLRNLAIAVAAFALGAGPLIVFNLRFPLATFRSNASFTFAEFPSKFDSLRTTLNGSSMFGYLVAEDGATRQPRKPSGWMETASAAVDAAAGGRRHWLDWALLAAILAVPLVWRTEARRPALFALIVSAVAWFQMAITRNAGGSAHHSVLVWPFPHMVIAVVLGQLSKRYGRAGLLSAGIITAILATGSLLVTNHYLAQMIRNGSTGAWTDAVYPLSRYLRDTRPAQVWAADWGIFDNILYLSRGRLSIGLVTELGMQPQPGARDIQLMKRLCAVPNALWVGHTVPYQEYEDINARMERVAREAGFRKQVEAVIRDRNGRPVYELYRLQP